MERGGEAVRPNDEEDEEGGPPEEGVGDLSSSHFADIGRGYLLY